MMRLRNINGVQNVAPAFMPERTFYTGAAEAFSSLKTVWLFQPEKREKSLLPACRHARRKFRAGKCLLLVLPACRLESMKIHVLMENTSGSPEYAAEHGLSLLIETGGYRILFDAGASSGFAGNAERLGLDLNDVDAAVLSHGHYDHGGGLTAFLERNSHAPVWVSPHAFERHLNAAGKDIGLDAGLSAHEQLRCTPQEIYPLFPGAVLYAASVIGTPYGMDSSGMSVQEVWGRRPEDFLHEQYLLLEEQGKRVLFSGCSHRGILNIAAYFRADVLVGGFHFMKWDSKGGSESMEYAAEVLLSFPTRYLTGHCTGAAAFEFLKERMGGRLDAFCAGQSITL